MNIKNKLVSLIQLRESETLDERQERELNELIQDVMIAGETDVQKGWERVQDKKLRRHNRRRVISVLRAAIIILPILIVATYFLNRREERVLTAKIEQQKQKSIVPLGKVAYLTKSSGEMIDLSKIVLDSTIVVDREDGARFIANEKSKEIEYNYLTVPRGGDYKITLSDGTKVWLNSASKMKFPVAFVGETREVWLEGEALFEVTKQNGKEFIVHTKKVDVNVKGTLFNVMAYDDEPTSETTLINGVVDVSLFNGASRVRLKPSQQAVLERDDWELKTKDVDTRRYVLSSEGILFFDNDRLDDIARRIERWYDVTIVFKNRDMMSKHFYGSIRKKQTIGDVLDMLSLTETIKYTIEGRKITIL